VHLTTSSGATTTAATSLGGLFSLSGLTPGAATLTVSAGAVLVTEQLSLVTGMTASVTLTNHGITTVSVGVLVIPPTPTYEALIALQWDASAGDHLGLGISFALPPDEIGTPPDSYCHVNAGQEECGEATWQPSGDAWFCAAPTCTQAVLDTFSKETNHNSCAGLIALEAFHHGESIRDACTITATDYAPCAPCMPLPDEPIQPTAKSEIIAIERWSAWSVPPTGDYSPPYLSFVKWEERLCAGYELESSPSMPGGGDFVDCIGNCGDGRGYCYSKGGLCANCVLWDADPSLGEVLCDAMGTPQGTGPLPGSAEWAAGVSDDLCDGTYTPAASCFAEEVWRRAAPRVSLIDRNGALVDEFTPPPGSGAGVNLTAPSPFATAACIDPTPLAGGGFSPMLRDMPWRLLDLASNNAVITSATSCTEAASLVRASTYAPDPSACPIPAAG